MLYDECDKCGAEDTLFCKRTEHGDYECLCYECSHEHSKKEAE